MATSIANTGFSFGVGATVVLSRFSRCGRGGMSILFAILLVPLFGAIGVAVDFGRGIAVRSSLQLAVDNAVLASRSGGEKNEDAIKARTEAFFQQNLRSLHGATIEDIKVSLDSNNVELRVKAQLPASFSVVLGKEFFEINVKSKAGAAAEDVEIALVLDNTGSMRNYMDDLKKGANDLVEAVYKGSSSKSKLKMAVVPYVGAVNIGNGRTQMAWMDVNGDSAWHGRYLEDYWFGYQSGCNTGSGGGGGGSGPGTGTTGSLMERVPTFASIGRWILGIGTANAASAADVPSPFHFIDPCWIANPNKINMFDLFARVPNASWKGCVMARAGDHDVLDTPPSAGDVNTLFVPWFWPDQPDAAEIAADGWNFLSANDYLADRPDLVPPAFDDSWNGWMHWSILKYNNSNAVIDEVGPDTTGPNKSCPDPILPLTDVKSDVLQAIDRMVHWNGSGTNVAEGLAWGWRVLSPEPPFTEGAQYGKIRKVLVLMTDGVNNIDPTPDGAIHSDYSAYGYLFAGIVPTPTFDGFKQHADNRMELVCNNAKNAGITIYTVAFGIVDGPTLAKLEACASKPPYAYAPGTETELIEAFNAIGASLTELRLTE
ncbi:MAG: hypothetical protein CTY20_05640 [Hyphomicrobium sp.]|nr:MAG: hypothetical protein CTY20_05640 [Hyphomicrobium sp.]